MLKCILLREGYLQKLRGKLQIGTKAQADRVVDMMDLLRQATVETVEAIEKWRQKSERAFVWNGMNYLLKIPSDLDFLDQSKPLIEWLSFRLVILCTQAPYSSLIICILVFCSVWSVTR